jgi:hypothetical protein
MGVPGEAFVVVLVRFDALHAGDPHEERRELTTGRGGVAGVCGGTCTMVFLCCTRHVLGFCSLRSLSMMLAGFALSVLPACGRERGFGLKAHVGL